MPELQADEIRTIAGGKADLPHHGLEHSRGEFRVRVGPAGGQVARASGHHDVIV